MRADDPRADEHIVADTFLRFKGLERPYVIVTEVTRGATSHYDCRIDIALTRATVCAVVVCSRQAAAADERLRGLIGADP